MAKFDLTKSPMYRYLGKRSDEEVSQGFCNLGELPLGFDESELSYFHDYADNDMDKDDSYSQSEEK